jgi:hypothetical protein
MPDGIWRAMLLENEDVRERISSFFSLFVSQHRCTEGNTPQPM